MERREHMPRRRGRRKAEEGVPQPAKSAGQAKETVDNAERPMSNLPPRAVLDALPERVRISLIEAASFSGPLPPPSMYGEYNRVLPGSADRILAMAEREQAHRVSIEGMALRASAKDSKLGQCFGFSLALFCVGGGVYLATQGQTIVSVALIVASAIGLAGRFLINRASR